VLGFLQSDERHDERAQMVREQIARRGITNPRVLAAMTTVPRHVFVPSDRQDEAYADRPLPIGAGQTISQPYMVAYMADVAGIEPGQRVMEIGAGCGYQATVIAAMGADVYALEIVHDLAERALPLLSTFKLANLHYHEADGIHGWPAAAQYDAIIFSCAVPSIHDAIFEQLAIGGRLIAPVNADSGDHQTIFRWHKTMGGKLKREMLISVRFVPMTGAIEKL